MDWKHATLHDNAMLGALVGLSSGGSLAIALRAGAGMVAFGMALGLVTGFVGGMLLWLETADLPEDPIPPVRSGVADGEARR